ncbi:sensor protein SrrB [bacterium BMS3Abin14]|nr:sensor protein SrrB [bacterium BMS3Abin14]
MEKTAARCQEISDRYTELSTVVRLGLELGVELNVEHVLEKIVQQIHEELGFGIVSIMLISDEGDYLSIRAARGLDDDIVASARTPVGEGIGGWVAKEGEPLLVNDIETHPQFRKLRSHGRYSSKSLISVPLKVGRKIIGVLNGNNRKDSNVLTEHDLRLLSVYASQASVTIERARLYRSLELQADELSEAYNQLKVLDRIKADFITNVSHEFRTPVTVIMGYLELLRGSLDEPEQVEKINIAMDASYRLAKLVDDSTDILRLDSGSMPFSFHNEDMGEFLRETLYKYSDGAAQKGVNIELDIDEILPPVFMDIEKMRKVAEKLIDNSIKFTSAGGRVRITCFAAKKGRVTVAIEDSGPGVPAGEQERAFEYFEQGGDIMTSKPSGTGLGLPIAKAIIIRHGGHLWFDRDHPKGCRILFDLPAKDIDAG